MMRSASVCVLLCLLGLAVLASLLRGCNSSVDRRAVPEQAIPAAWPRPAFDTIGIEVGGHPVTVEIADTPERRRYGYMFVTEIADHEGMLFVYPKNRAGLNFWMRNTRVPLDLLYLREDGTIINIHENMKPLRDRPSYDAAEPCRFVLELPGGWLARHKVWMRHRVTLPRELRERVALPDALEQENIPDLLGAGGSGDEGG